MNHYAVIMAGGSGTRLWPLSRKKCPKQFLSLWGEDSLLVSTIKRLDGIISREHIIIVGNKEHEEVLLEETAGLLPTENILMEPTGRNTAPCVAYCERYIREIKNEENFVMCILPADHYIKDEVEFRRTLSASANAAEQTGAIATIGMKPTYAATGYGYIKYLGAVPGTGGAYEVERFIEKPNQENAEIYLKEGGYFWNGGIFLMRADVLRSSMNDFLPEVEKGICLAFEQRLASNEAEEKRIYASVESISIDYGIMEKSDDMIVFPGDFGWNDIGSFDAITDIVSKDDRNNAAWRGAILTPDSENITAYTQTGKPVAILGISDAVIIDTEDVLYICKSGRTEETKKIVGMLDENSLGNLK